MLPDKPPNGPAAPPPFQRTEPHPDFFARGADLSAALPPPIPDEPPQLRARLADEIRDHLEIALRRELLTTSDPAAARARVLQRFGDPRLLLLRLWRDALWEELLMQRLQFAVLMLVLAAVTTLTFFSWQALADTRRANAELLTHVAKLSEAMSKAAVPAAPAPAAVNPEWNAARIVCVDVHGKPVAGVVGELYSENGGLRDAPYSGSAVSDENGVIDLGLLQPRTFEMLLRRDGMISPSFRFSVQAGRTFERRVVVPEPPARRPVQIRVEWPEGIDAQLLVTLVAISSRVPAAEKGSGPWQMEEASNVLFVADARRTVRLDHPNLQFHRVNDDVAVPRLGIGEPFRIYMPNVAQPQERLTAALPEIAEGAYACGAMFVFTGADQAWTEPVDRWLQDAIENEAERTSIRCVGQFLLDGPRQTPGRDQGIPSVARVKAIDGDRRVLSVVPDDEVVQAVRAALNGKKTAAVR